MSDETPQSGSFQVPSEDQRATQSVRSFAERFNLTLREREVFALLVMGRAQKEIAAELGVAEPTVRFHAVRSYAKCGVHNQREMLALFARTLQEDAAKADGDRAPAKPNILTG